MWCGVGVLLGDTGRLGLCAKWMAREGSSSIRGRHMLAGASSCTTGQGRRLRKRNFSVGSLWKGEHRSKPRDQSSRGHVSLLRLHLRVQGSFSWHCCHIRAEEIHFQTKKRTRQDQVCNPCKEHVREHAVSLLCRSMLCTYVCYVYDGPGDNEDHDLRQGVPYVLGHQAPLLSVSHPLDRFPFPFSSVPRSPYSKHAC